jgi:hypothetical protein
LVAFAEGASLKNLRDLQQKIISTKPLVLATSPDQAALDKVGAWASNGKASL